MTWEALLFALACLIATVLALVSARQRRGRDALGMDRRALERFAGEVGGVLSRVEGEGALLVGTYEGRRITVRPVDRSTDGLVLQLGVAVDPDIRLKIRPPSLVGRVFGGGTPSSYQAVGEGADRVFVHGGEELVALLDELLGSGRTDEVIAENGWLYLECELERLRPTWLRWFFARMTRLARFYERRPVIVRPAEKPRFAWTGGGEASCPYCRDDIDPEDEALVACADCGTLHHAACFDEHGSCTIYGCGGAQERVQS